MGFVMAGCSLDKDTIVAACTPPFVSRIYNKGHIISAASITNNSSLSLDIQKWMDNNSSGWQTSYTTFAPSLEIRNNNMTLNFTDEFAVLNIKNPKTGEWNQFIKKVDISGIEFLKVIKTKAEPAAALYTSP